MQGEVAVTVSHASPASTWTGAGRIDSPADVERLLGTVNAAAGRRTTTGDRLRVVDQADAVLSDAGPARRIAVHPLLAPLLPWSGGLRRGATVAAVGATSLQLALLGSAMGAGGYAAVIGMPALGA